MKSENQIIVRRKKPVKIERPLKCLLTFSQSVGERMSHFFQFLEFMFLDIDIFWALLRAHFNPRLTAWVEMSLRRAQNIFIPANINSNSFILVPDFGLPNQPSSVQ